MSFNIQIPDLNRIPSVHSIPMKANPRTEALLIRMMICLRMMPWALVSMISKMSQLKTSIQTLRNNQLANISDVVCEIHDLLTPDQDQAITRDLIALAEALNAMQRRLNNLLQSLNNKPNFKRLLETEPFTEVHPVVTRDREAINRVQEELAAAIRRQLNL
jgi:vacuolar-type H+-ATPase subunit I/STV1